MADLPAGPRLVAEQRTGDRFALQLSVEARPWPDTQDTYGLRHLLEHIVAKGPIRDLDTRLESRGATLTAATTRDAMFFTVEGPATELQVAFEAMREILRKPAVTQEELTLELLVMEQELALVGETTRLVGAAWRKSFADYGVDPFGSMESFRRFTAADLDEAHQRMFSGRNVVLSYVGPDEPNAVRELATRLIESPRQAPPMPEGVDRRGSLPGAIEVTGPGGIARALGGGSFANRETLARIGVALALGPGIEPVYTPSRRDGLVVLVAPRRETLETAVSDALEQGGAFLAQARRVVEGWLRSLDRPAEQAEMNGLLVRIDRELTVDELRRRAASLTEQELRQALAAWIPTPEGAR